VKGLNCFVSRIQKDILAEVSKEAEFSKASTLTNYERVEDFVEILRMINEEFDETYSTGISVYRELLKDNDFFKKLPVRTE
jgi:hypothetical protein